MRSRHSISRYRNPPSGTVACFALLALALVALPACQPGGAPEETAEAPAGERVENASIGLAIAELDPFFAVQANEEGGIILVPADGSSGVLTISTADPGTASGAVNLVAAVESHKADLETRTNGEFKGQREIGGPLGTAFYSRGNFDAADGTRTEETVIFAIHPSGTQRLDLVYEYPAGDDTATRLQDQLFAVFGEIEGLESAAEGGGEAEGDGQ